MRCYSRGEFAQIQLIEKLGPDVAAYVRPMIGDVRDSKRLALAMRDCDVVIHAAALKQVPVCDYNPSEAIETNILGSRNVAMAAIDAGVERAMLISTDKAAQPSTFYGVTKAAAEKVFCHSNVYVGSGRRTTIGAVRYGNVMGSRGSVIHVWRSQIARGEPITITDPEATRFWISMPQAVEFVLSSVEMLEAGDVFIPKLETSTVGDLADLVAGNRKRVVTGLRPSEKMHEVLLGEDETASRPVTPLVDRYVLGRGPTWTGTWVYSSDDPSLRMRPDRLAALVAELPA